MVLPEALRFTSLRSANSYSSLNCEASNRPATIVTALALTALTGLANVVVGVVVLVLLLLDVLPSTSGPGSRTLLTLGLAYVVIGGLTLAGAAGLLTHRPGSRAFVTVVMMVRIALASISFGIIGTWYSAGSVLGIVVAVVVVALLWDSRANAYFHRPA